MKNLQIIVILASVCLLLIEAHQSIGKYICEKGYSKNGYTKCLSIDDESDFETTNCYYTLPKDGLGAGQHFYQFEFKSGSYLSVGFTTREHFIQGIEMKGLLYDGRLNNERTFGSSIKQGDTIQLLLNVSDETLKMYVIHNDVPLGLGYDLKISEIPNLYPTIVVDGSAEVCIEKLENLPSKIERQPKICEGIEGDFEIVQVIQGEEVISSEYFKLHSWNSVKLHVKKWRGITPVETYSFIFDGEYDIGVSAFAWRGCYQNSCDVYQFFDVNVVDPRMEGDTLKIIGHNNKIDSYVNVKKLYASKN
ncbi:hypothetical protein B4U79_18489 [Dinothrombium tinctorium]|uniref:Galectin n=1 Tax=Dinothrombium tinctorium TaxID=1965070 RepID=A0A443QHB5_9ACAR|nr:hypothetical protein B4U79_18489 [Dinothrombium tinctorium]